MSRTVIHDFDEALSRPLRLRSRTELRGARVTLADDYAGGWMEDGRDQRGDFGVVRVEAGARDVTIDGLEIEGPGEAWWLARRKPVAQPWVWATRGVTVVGAVGVTLSNVRVSQMIAEGFYFRDFTDLTVLDAYAERVNSGMAFDWPRAAGNARLRVDGFTAVDMWAVDGLNKIGPSVLRPGSDVGGNFVYGSGLVDSSLSRINSVGEGKGIKITQSQGLELSGIRTPQLYLGGKGTAPAGWTGPPSARGYHLRDSVLGESHYGFSADHTSDPAALTCWGPTEDEALVERTTIYAPRPGRFVAPWWDSVSPNFRYPAVQNSTGFRLRLAASVAMVDLDGDAPEPRWIDGDARALVTAEPGITYRRFVPTWKVA